MENIFIESGFNADHKSNHTLNATTISRMTAPSNVIMERSEYLPKYGHVSYEPNTEVQHQTSSWAWPSGDIFLVAGLYHAHRPLKHVIYNINIYIYIYIYIYTI